jgi:hypothetical protein
MYIDMYDIESLGQGKYRVEYVHKNRDCVILVDGQYGGKFLLEVRERVVYLKAHNICPQAEIVKETNPGFDRFGNAVGGI